LSVQYLKEMTWEEVNQKNRETTVVMIAAGPIEQHGPQAPLGTDLYIAEFVMKKCADYLSQNHYDVIIAPTVPYVNALFSLNFPGSVSVRRKIVEEYIYDILASFAMDGFIHIVLTSQHVDPPWIRAAESACDRVNADYGTRAIHGFERIVVDLISGHSELRLDHLNLQGDSHAGVYETAPMLYIHEKLVKTDYLGKLPAMPIEFTEMTKGRTFRDLGNGLGYTGDLAQVNKEVGGAIAEHYANRFKQLILRHVEGKDVYSSLKCSDLAL
jgi:creatinine amidohydrolase